MQQKGIMQMTKRGETREKILKAATEIFFHNGYEATSVRDILEKADVVTGSFYHYFPSKELLLEAVVERFLMNYSQKVSVIIENEDLSIMERLDLFVNQMKETSVMYYEVLQVEKMHWTLQYALQTKSVEALIPSVIKMIEKGKKDGIIQAKLDVDTKTLAVILVKGIEGIICANTENCKDLKNLTQVQESIKEYMQYILQVKEE